MAALKTANEIRLLRSTIKKQVKNMPSRDSRAAVAQLIRANPDVWQTAPLTYMLRMPSQTGPVTAQRWLKQTGITSPRKLGQLTDRQRDLLADLIERETV